MSDHVLTVDRLRAILSQMSDELNALHRAMVDEDGFAPEDPRLRRFTALNDDYEWLDVILEDLRGDDDLDELTPAEREFVAGLSSGSPET